MIWFFGLGNGILMHFRVTGLWLCVPYPCCSVETTFARVQPNSEHHLLYKEREGIWGVLMHGFSYKITYLATSPSCSAPVSCQCSGDPLEIRCSISSSGVTSSAVLSRANKPHLERAGHLFNCLRARSAGAREGFEPRAPTQPLPLTWLSPTWPGRTKCSAELQTAGSQELPWVQTA